MSMNRVQFQPGLPMSELIQLYGAEAQCEAALMQARWPTGFCCPGCGHGGYCLLSSRARKTYQCNSCHRQTSLRGSENKVPFVTAVSVDDEGHPNRIKLTPVSGFTTEAITAWPYSQLSAGCTVFSDGLVCFGGVSAAGCRHIPVVAGGRKPNELPEFRWVNTVLGNVKTSLSGAYHAFDFSKYASRYLAAIAYRFKHRFQLKTLPHRLLVAAVAIGPRPETRLRLAEDSC